MEQFGKYSRQFLLQLHNDLVELVEFVTSKRDKAAFERTIKILKKELGHVAG